MNPRDKKATSLAIIFSGTYINSQGKNSSTRRVEHFLKGFSEYLDTSLLISLYNNKDLNLPEDIKYKVYNLGAKKVKNKLIGKIVFLTKLLLIIHKYDTIFLYDVRVDIVPIFLFAKLTGKFIINHISDNFEESTDNNLIKLLYKYSNLLYVKFSNINIVISTAIKNKIIKMTNNPIMVVPIMVDINEFKNIATSSKFKPNFVIGYTGSFWNIYGVKYLLEAFKLFSKGKKTKLIIAGPEKFTVNHDNVPYLIEKLKISNNVIFLGWLNTKDLINLISSCDIMVMPHTNHPFCQYGMPYKIAEYASMNKAIISTKVADIETYFINNYNALLSEPNSVESILSNLEAFYNDRTLLKKCGNNARELSINKFHYTNTIGDLIYKINKIKDT